MDPGERDIILQLHESERTHENTCGPSGILKKMRWLYLVPGTVGGFVDELKGGREECGD